MFYSGVNCYIKYTAMCHKLIQYCHIIPNAYLPVLSAVMSVQLFFVSAFLCFSWGLKLTRYCSSTHHTLNTFSCEYLRARISVRAQVSAGHQLWAVSANTNKGGLCQQNETKLHTAQNIFGRERKDFDSVEFSLALLYRSDVR